jgi:hypothetical protein
VSRLSIEAFTLLTPDSQDHQTTQQPSTLLIIHKVAGNWLHIAFVEMISFPCSDYSRSCCDCDSDLLFRLTFRLGCANLTSHRAKRNELRDIVGSLLRELFSEENFVETLSLRASGWVIWQANNTEIFSSVQNIKI